MNSQLYLARAMVAGRAHSSQDLAVQRTAELARQADRTAERTARRAARRLRRA